MEVLTRQDIQASLQNGGVKHALLFSNLSSALRFRKSLQFQGSLYSVQVLQMLTTIRTRFTGPKENEPPRMRLRRVYSRSRICLLGQWFFTFWVLGITARSIHLSSALPFTVPMLAYIVSVVSVHSLQNWYFPKISLHEAAHETLFRPRLNTKAPLGLCSRCSHVLSSQDRQTGLTYRGPAISMVYAHLRCIFPYVVRHYGLRGARASKNFAIRQ